MFHYHQRWILDELKVWCLQSRLAGRRESCSHRCKVCPNSSIFLNSAQEQVWAWFSRLRDLQLILLLKLTCDRKLEWWIRLWRRPPSLCDRSNRRRWSILLPGSRSHIVFGYLRLVLLETLLKPSHVLWVGRLRSWARSLSIDRQSCWPSLHPKGLSPRCHCQGGTSLQSN